MVAPCSNRWWDDNIACWWCDMIMSLPAIDLTFLLSASSQQNSRGLQNPKSWHVEIGTSSTALAFLLTSTNSLVSRILLVCVVCLWDNLGKHLLFNCWCDACDDSHNLCLRWLRDDAPEKTGDKSAISEYLWQLRLFGDNQVYLILDDEKAAQKNPQ